MVCGVFGLPGSGKSLALARFASLALAGKPLRVGSYYLQDCPGFKYDRVYTNFSCPGCYKLDFETLGKCDYRNSLFIIDEIMLYADSRSFKSFSDDLKFFFSQHRKSHIDVIYASQMYDDCDKKIRGITHSLFYVNRAPLGMSSLIPIECFFDVSNGSIVSGYRFAPRFRRRAFRRSRYYDLVDSYAFIGKTVSVPPPSEMWSDCGSPLNRSEKMKVRLLLGWSVLKRKAAPVNLSKRRQ